MYLWLVALGAGLIRHNDRLKPVLRIIQRYSYSHYSLAYLTFI